MTKRRIFFWMGLTFLFVLGLSQEGLSKETYKVKNGDTLSKISSQFGVPVKDLMRMNGLKKPALKPGQRLTVSQSPSKKSSKHTVARSNTSTKSKADSYTVKRGDTLQSIAKKSGISIAELKGLNGMRNSTIKTGQKLILAKHQSVPSAVKENKGPRVVMALDVEDNELYPEEDAEEGEIPDEDWTSVERDKEASTQLMGKWNSPKERQIFVRVVKGFLGTPYRFGGSSVRGIDCSAFVAKVYQFFDVKLPRTAREQSRMGVRVAKSDLEEGDLVFFNTRRAFGHVGIYIGNNEFIHASSGRSGKHVRIDSLDKPYYNQRFIKAVRVKGMKNVQSDERDVS